MAQKERLVELLKDADEKLFDAICVSFDEYYNQLADYLLQNGVIVPPCKVGAEVYYIAENPFDETKSIQVGFVTRIYVGDRWMSYALGSEFGRINIGICKSANAFITREAAEQALKERETK